MKTRMAQDARFLPVGENGRATGIKVYGIQPHGHMAELGLRDGDCIVAVNDHTIAEHSRGVLRTLYLERQLVLRVKRDGELRLLYWRSAPGDRVQ